MAENQLLLEQRWQHHREPALLAASGGAIDTISFITLFGLFTAHVTGNLVVAGAALATNSEGILSKLLAIPVFMLAVAIVTLVIKRRKIITPRFLGGLFVVEILLLLLFGLLGLLWQPFIGADSVTALITGMAGVMAMGVRNATTRLLLPATSPSTMMTGNVTQLTIDVVNWCQAPNRENRVKIKKSGGFGAWFSAGSRAWGAGLYPGGLLLGAYSGGTGGHCRLARIQRRAELVLR
ncbi:TPA: DUF1275 domain-containing protein [Klebsiella aerogenes]|nr:DUF1275 domain-containing protein [Klebsiella aerogenes]